MHRYPVRSYGGGLDDIDLSDKSGDTIPSCGYESTTTAYTYTDNSDLPFNELPELPSEPTHDGDYDMDVEEEARERARQARMSDVEKTLLVLELIKNIPHFSIPIFLVTLFTSTVLLSYANKFYSDKSHTRIMSIWYQGTRPSSKCRVLKAAGQAMDVWVADRAAELCAREASFLTDKSSKGPFKTEASRLHVPGNKVTVEHVQGFQLSQLLPTYKRTLPILQHILSAVVNKDAKVMKEGSRDPDHGRTLVTSMLLNLRSRLSNLHGLMNSLLLWDNRVPKRLIQALNNYGFCPSYGYLCCAILSLSKSALRRARITANDSLKMILFPYDNFNWLKQAHEVSVLHGSVQHDQVLALLVIMPPVGEKVKAMTAAEITDLKAFEATQGTRHKLTPEKSLSSILPSKGDYLSLRENFVLLVARILTEEIPSLSPFVSHIPAFTDAKELPSSKTEEYYLPTFDQEQGSTKGNMLVLQHYFEDVLRIPRLCFESTMYTVLGDRLTTARDRAAQDQQAVDTSKDKLDHLSSFSMISGLMHYNLNFIQAVGGTFWGSTSADDPLSLVNLRDLLPNRQEIQLRSVNYYVFLRFFDAIFRALILRASIVLCGFSSSKDLTTNPHTTLDELLQHSKTIVDSFIIQPPNRLKATGVKTLEGNTISSNAVLLMHSIASLTEMQSAIKHGHPTRIKRVLKLWLLMFYAAGSYNYANETMELLHNTEHDWPQPYADTAMGGMVVNPHGRKLGCKPTDIRVEHLNDQIKEHTDGANASPELLEKITPAMGHVHEMTEGLFEDLGVERQNQKHKHVSQQRDIQLLLDHFNEHSVFDFNQDKSSSGSFVDLFAEGIDPLGGPNGGHAKHLQRHELRLRVRHNELRIDLSQSEMDAITELEVGRYAGGIGEFTIVDPDHAMPTLEEIRRVGEEFGDREEED